MFAQGLSPSTPAKEYIRFNGQVVAIENAHGTQLGPPMMSIDVPSGNPTLSGPQTFSGWAVDSTHAIASVAISIDGTPYGQANYGISRQDVCNVYPGLGCPNVGWTFSFNTNVLSDGGHTLSVTATTDDSRSRTLTAGFSTSNQSSSPLLNIDFPSGSPTISSYQVFTGWAVDASSPLASLAATIDGVSYDLAIPRFTSRPDICAVHYGPDCANNSNVGWRFAVDTRVVPDGPHTFSLTFTTQDNRVTTASASFTSANYQAGSIQVGAYYTVVNKATGKVLDVSGYSTDDGAQIGQWTNTGGANQQWFFIPTLGGYKIISFNSAKVMDVEGDEVYQYSFSGGNNQRWNMNYLGNAYFSITSVDSGLALQVQDQDTYAANLSAYSGSDNQQWQLFYVRGPDSFSPGDYKVINRKSGKALDMPGASTDRGTAADQYDYAAVSWDQWTFTDRGGYFQITNDHSNLALEIGGAIITDGQPAQQWDFWGGGNQRWLLLSIGNGYYEIVNQNSGLCLDISGGSVDNGAIAIQWDYWGGPNQEWQILPVQ
ncbi:MAG: RICIN domain-containing protein [Acidobacteriaceae bacterium]|nr:RICIN domain-containing protein [Acidobacteriaceae bacterium]